MSQSSAPYGTVEVRIPILQREQSVIDEYGGASGRNQFEMEMRKMEEEMSKLTGQISEGNKRMASRIVQTTKTTTTRTSSGGVDSFQAQPAQQLQQLTNLQQNTSNSQTLNQSNFVNQFDIQPQQQLQGANIQEKRTTTVHKTITHSNSGQNILQNQGQPQPQPAQVQWQAPSNAGSNLQESRSVHSTTTHSTTGGQSNIADPGQQPQSVQWQTPAAAGSVSEQRSSHSTHTTTTHSTTGTQQQLTQQQQNTNQTNNQFESQNNTELQQWLGNLQSPLISGHQEISGQDGKCLRLRFDVSQYRPDEVSVKTVDGKLKIHAKHEEKSEMSSSYREFNKEFSLPIGTNPAAIKSTLSKDGILTIEAPFPNQLTAQNYLPITNY